MPFCRRSVKATSRDMSGMVGRGSSGFTSGLRSPAATRSRIAIMELTNQRVSRKTSKNSSRVSGWSSLSTRQYPKAKTIMRQHSAKVALQSASVSVSVGLLERAAKAWA